MSRTTFTHITKKRQVFVYLHPLTHLFGIAGPSQVFWEANALVPDIYRLHFVSFTSEFVTPQGVGINRVKPLANAHPENGDMIIVPGVDLNAYLARTPSAPEIESLNWIREQFRKGVNFFSIGSGTIILARSGILDGKRCTSHWKCSDYFNTHHQKIIFEESKIFIKDGPIMTSAGMSANIDSTLAIIEEDHGPVFTSRLALELLVFIRRFGNENQRSYFLDYKTHFNPLVHHAQNIISSNLKKNYTNAELARLTNTSERNLTRIFKNTLGISITEFKNKLRIELARHLFNNKSLTISQIATECGYANPRQLKRIWKRNNEEAIKNRIPA